MDIINGNIINHESLYFVLGYLQEFMYDKNTIYYPGDNYTKSSELNDKHNKNGIICSEEKEDIIKIIDEIINYICICPICNNKLNFLIDGQTYNCSQCNKYFKMNNDYDFEETDYPYKDKNVDY